ncbi:hypothetical protein UNSWDHB_184 [Dehalobacter sp. UNSWDHB]|uniref:DUF4446 family protein n=1 Tax=unclassified Dehalobacter TaxID=2635733 RepID=UPI00028B7456|nr:MULTISPECIES: DUF4446 family protein [unclassified Dehalobacter]AFV03997.1 hypothetical protein DHBDCA_p2970 [Dehalobacter sp. DCA]AFV06977.1 hypothetical protein DCF50_p2974 [Dehalobacter sp. CF]EQB22493.1 hypothetical protein UNSWDHB_184 [Dehalobacter sp. UNSWDHB]
MFSVLEPEMIVVLAVSVVALIVTVIAIVMTNALRIRMSKFEKSYISLQTFLSGTQLEELLSANLKEVAELSRIAAEHGQRLKLAEDKVRNGIDRAELVRFNSFENMGADLSFTLALLNQEKTGVVLTGIHSVEECRIYAKGIEKGQANVKLSPEEKLAIEKASKNELTI